MCCYWHFSWFCVDSVQSNLIRTLSQLSCTNNGSASVTLLDQLKMLEAGCDLGFLYLWYLDSDSSVQLEVKLAAWGGRRAFSTAVPSHVQASCNTVMYLNELTDPTQRLCRTSNELFIRIKVVILNRPDTQRVFWRPQTWWSVSGCDITVWMFWFRHRQRVASRPDVFLKHPVKSLWQRLKHSVEL